MGKEEGKIYYVCFYADKDVEDKIVSFPSVWSKIDYVASVMKELGHEVEIVSIAMSKDGVFKGYKRRVDEKESVRYLSSYSPKNRILQRFSVFFHWVKILAFLLLYVKKDDTLFVYHTLFNRFWLKLYHDVFHRQFLLEIEDVFSALSEDSRHFAEEEWRLFGKAKACICVNDLIAKKLTGKCKTIISYGSYLLPAYHASDNQNKTRLVYAGVIEQVRRAAFLAAEAMRYLPDSYELLILGFGQDNDIAALNALIDEINADGIKKVSYFGRMSGDVYYDFLQSCDIGLSTHMYDESSMASADNTFPSKVLVYLANGLPVVAQRLECLEISSVNPALNYYDTPTPQSVARAIMRVDMKYDTRALIGELDEKFKRELGVLLKLNE